MSRGLFRKTSFNKIFGAYRSQWKRFWMRLFTFGMYGRKGMGWWNNPKKAWYNFWYHRTSISIPRLLGYKPSRLSLFCAMLVASVASVFAAPVDATRAGIKAHKIKSARKARAESTTTGSSSSTSHSNGNSNRSTSGNARTSPACESGFSAATSESTNANTRPQHHTSGNTPKKSSPSGRSTTAKSRNTSTTEKPKITYAPTVTPLEEEKPNQTVAFTSTAYSHEPVKPVTIPEPEVKEPDENTPKSKPKHEKDQYIRKRMFIAGSSYCDKAVLEKLSVGTYFEVVAEPDNPHDKDAVMLMYDGNKIGYIAKKDNTPFSICLRLNRKVYGVITDIITEQTSTKYEFETWFDSEK